MNRLRLGLSLAAVAAVLASSGCVTSSPHFSGSGPISPAPMSSEPSPDGSASPSGPAATPATSPASTNSPVATVACAWGPPNPAAVATGTPPATVPASGAATMLIVTNLGSITIELDRAATPCTVASFAYLASIRFFNEAPCHRLTTAGAFLLQCGDPTGTGNGGPSYTIPDEALPPPGATVPAVNYPRGTVAMANYSRPDTGGSQFFLIYRDSSLPDAYTKFGTVTSGIEVLDSVALAGVKPSSPNGPNDGPPELALKVLSLTMVAS